MESDNDSPIEEVPLMVDTPIIDDGGLPPPFQLDQVKQSDDDDEPSEFGDDDALLSVGDDDGDIDEQRSDRFSNSANPEKGGSQTGTQGKDDSRTGTHGKSSHGKNSSRGGSGTEANTSFPSGSDSRSVSGSVLTGIKTAEIRKKQSVVPIITERKTSLHARKSLEHISEFSLNGLIGRDTEVSQLKACFDRMSQMGGATSPKENGASSNFRLSSKQMFLMSGVGGVGKSVIARTLKDEVGNAGIFVDGKFDMNSTDEPYSAIASAYGKICQHIKNKVPEAIPNVQAALEKDLGDEVQLMAQLIKDLNDLLKDQSEEAQTSAFDIAAIENGLDRMRYAFRVLTRIFTNLCSPMILFLDDLQWADISSLQMIDFLLTDTQNPNPLMILGCYRSEEVDENSLLYNKIIGMREKSDVHGFSMTEMEVGPFQVHNIEEVITKTMPCGDENKCHELAELCLKRTLGNPFFLLEFLRMLQLEHLVAYDMSSLTWNWDLAKIEEATMSTANVAMLLQGRMRKLPQQVQSFLQCAAYLGSTFSIASITAIWNTYGRRLTEGKMQRAPVLLDMILAKDFVEKYGTRHYRWVHDKVQEAALDVRPIRDSFQLDIGTSLYYSLDPLQLEEDLFTVVDLINTGNIKKRPEYAEVNHRAAQKAMSVSAYQAAFKYASHGIALLEKTGWVESRSLMVKLCTISAETGVILGDLEVAERRCQEVLNREEVPDIEKLALKLIKERIMSSEKVQCEASLKYCLDLLHDLGCSLQQRKLMIAVQSLRKSFALIKKLKKLPIEAYAKMESVTDRKQKAIVGLLSRANYHALNLSDFMLGQLTTCKMIEMTLAQGIHEASASSIAFLGIFAVALSGDVDTALALADVALHMIQRSGKLRNGETIVMANCYLLSFRSLLDNMQGDIYKGYTEGLRVGDTEYAFWGLLAHQTLIPHQIGRPLDDILEAIPGQMVQYEESSEAFHLVAARIFNQMFANLKVTSIEDPCDLEGEIFSKSNEGKVEKGLDKGAVSLVIYAENELIFFSGDYIGAAKHALKVGEELEKLLGSLFMVFLDAYHRAAALYAAAIQTKQRKYKGAAKKVRSKIEKWKAKGNPNVLYYCMHLNAEQAVLDKKFDNADKFYKCAIESVTKLNHLHHCAFIRERYADFLERDRELVDESKKWLTESVDYYRKWGAEGRAENLESRLNSMQ